MQEYPLAHGHVHITHADDVSAAPDFVPGYFESSVPRHPIWSLLEPFFFFIYQSSGRAPSDVGIQGPA